MIYSVYLLLICATVSVSSRCVDGEDNIIRIHDNSKGKGKIIFKDIEVATYDKNKKPICIDGKPQFTFPGHFKLHKGTFQVVEGVKDGANPLKLEISLEKKSWLVGVVCENGKSKNQFIPDEMCTFDLCKLTSMCSLLSIKMPQPVEATSLIENDMIDIGPMPIPQLGGEWKLSVKLVQGKSVLASLMVGKPNEWLSVESVEGEGSIEYTNTKPNSHEEL